MHVQKMTDDEMREVYEAQLEYDCALRGVTTKVTLEDKTFENYRDYYNRVISECLEKGLLWYLTEQELMKRYGLDNISYMEQQNIYVED